MELVRSRRELGEVHRGRAERVPRKPRAELRRLRHTSATRHDSAVTDSDLAGGFGMRLALQGVLVGSLLLAVTSCSDASSHDRALASSAGSSVSGLASSAASTASTDPKADAQAGLDAYWAMVKRLLAAPDPGDPEIDQRAVDPARSAFEDLLTTRQSLGEVVRYDGVPYRVELSVTTASRSSAEFEGCVVDGAQVIDSKSGQVVNSAVTTSRLSGTLVQASGVWKMQRFDVLRKVDGEVPCDSLA